MAYDTRTEAVYSGRPAFVLSLYVRRDQTDVGNNRSTYAWELRANNPTGGGSYALDCFGWSVNIGGQIFNGCHNLDFRNRPGYIVLGSGSTGWFGHDGNGYLNMWVSAGHYNASIFGTAQTPSHYWETDRIPKVPGAPNGGVVDQATVNSLRYRFSGTTDGGSAIQEWQAQADDDPNFGSPFTYGSSGTTTFTGLNPGIRYYFRARGRNGVGWGPWGAGADGLTLPATPPSISVIPSLSGGQAVVTLSPPNGVSSVSSYWVDYRPVGSTSFLSQNGGSPMTVTGLTPGRSYEWRASAMIGTYESPKSAWIMATQPNPNTSSGEYFDGSSPAKEDVTFEWDGTAGVSTSRGVAASPAGWMSFEQGSADSGGDGVVMRSVGGMGGGRAARVVFFADTIDAGFVAGIDYDGADVIVPGAPYFGSLHVNMAETSVKPLQPGVAWFDDEGEVISYSWSNDLVVPTPVDWVRVYASGIAPMNAEKAAPVVRDVTTTSENGYGHGAYGHLPYGHGDNLGAGWVPYRGGEALLLDRAMTTLSSLFPYFDGNTPDTMQYAYSWLGDPDESVSIRETLSYDGSDLLLDPDCPPLPAAPMPPTITDECIDEVGTWRRYWVIIPVDRISEWLEVIPTVTVYTGGFAARQVRIRVYANPDGVEPGEVSTDTWEAEQIISYMPPNTALTLDGVAERVWASVDGGPAIPANRLLYGTGGGPASWPVMSCGTAYVMSFDVPVDAPDGNISVDMALTTRML